MARKWEYRVVSRGGPASGMIHSTLKDARLELKWLEQREQSVVEMALVLGIEPEDGEVWWIEGRDLNPWVALQSTQAHDL